MMLTSNAHDSYGYVYTYACMYLPSISLLKYVVSEGNDCLALYTIVYLMPNPGLCTEKLFLE